MRDRDTAFLAVDVTGTALDPNAPRRISRLLETLSGMPLIGIQQRTIAGDGGVLEFAEVNGAFEALQMLVREWAAASKKPEVSPLLLGLRAAVHQGAPGSRSYAHVEELLRCCSTNAGVFSAPAFACLGGTGTPSRALFERRWTGTRYGLEWGHSWPTEVYGFELSALLEEPQYLVRLEPKTKLIARLASHPGELHMLSPRRFEEVVAELFADTGYDVELTGQTRDNGIDIVAVGLRDGLELPGKFLVQCKRYRPGHKVGISVVHELLGVGAEEPNTGLVIATTSFFTGPALKCASRETVKWRLHLKDYDAICDWLGKYSKKHGV